MNDDLTANAVQYLLIHTLRHKMAPCAATWS